MDFSASLRLIVAVALALAAGTSRADEVADAGKLVQAGEAGRALAEINKVLATRPKDPQARFLKGLIFADRGDAQGAIDVFRKLTEDYPELPEPYNNLAVVYASQGRYDEARTALEQSIRTHPSYATAYENLGDVYARLASQAYDRALKLDSANTGAQNKLALVRTLMGSAPGAPPAPALSTAAPAPGPSAPPSPPPAAQPGGPLDSVAAWAAAWSRQDVEAYLSAYAGDFRTPDGMPRAAWEEQRRERLTAPKSISVRIDAPRVRAETGDRVSVSFRQHYRSDRFRASSMKTLLLGRAEDGRWRILREEVGR